MVLLSKVSSVIIKSVNLRPLIKVDRVDPIEYNRLVDDRLELDEVLKPSKELSELLKSLDRRKVKPWILTNAYITHAKRVLKLLDITQYFEGLLPERMKRMI